MALTEEARVRLGIDGGAQAEEQMKQLEQAASRLQKQINAIGKTDPARKDLLKKDLRDITSEIRSIQKQIDQINRYELIINGKAAGASLKELENAARKLYQELRKLPESDKDFATKTQQYQRVRSEIDRLNSSIKGTGGLFSRLGDEVKAFGVVAASYLGFQFITEKIRNVIQSNARLSDSLAEVRQTTGLTAREVQELNKALGKIDTRTSTAELRDIAKVAGQFGVAKEDILSFTDAINKSAVVLKTEFSGGAEDIAGTLAGLRNVLGDIKTSKIDQDLLKIGNGLIVLAQSGIATAPVVSDFTRRIGGVGIQLGLTSGEVLGLSATLQELNVSTERGGTAVSRILQKMATDTATFAKVAGVPLEEFRRMVDEDIYSAFLKFVEGTQSGGQSATEFATILKDAELSGAGAGEVIAKLASNLPLLQDKVNLAGEAIKKTDAITEQYGIKNNTLGGQLDRLGKRFYEFASNKSVSNFFASGVEKINNFLDSLSNLPERLQRNAALIISLSGATLLYYRSVVSATSASLTNTTAELANAAGKKAVAFWTALSETATKAYALATDVLTGRITVATAATRIWNAVLALNPAGLIITAITALAAAITLYAQNTKAAIALEREKHQLTKNLTSANDELQKSLENVSSQVAQLNKLSPEQQANLREEIKLKLANAQATMVQFQADQEKIRQDASKPGVWQSVGNAFLSIYNPLTFAARQAEDALKNGTEAAEKFNDPIAKTAQLIKGLKDQLLSARDPLEIESEAMRINAVTAAAFEEKLRLLKEALKNVKVGGIDYKRIENEIAQTNRAFEKLKPPALINIDADATLKHYQEQIKKLFDLQTRLQRERIRQIQDQEEAEKAELTLKFDLDAREIKADIDLLEGKKNRTAQEEELFQTSRQLLLGMLENYEKDFQAITDKYAQERRKKAYLDDLGNLDHFKKQEQLKISTAYASGEIDKKTHDERMKTLDENYLKGKLSLAMEHGQNTMDILQEIANFQIQKNEEVTKNTLETDEQRLQSTLNTLAAVSRAVQFTGDFITRINELQATQAEARHRREIRILDDKHDHERKKFKELLDRKIISQRQYDDHMEELERQRIEKEEDFRRKQADKAKRAAIVKIIVQTAVNVIEAFPDYYEMAAALALGALELGSASSATYEKGGLAPQAKGGVAEGPSHKEGGLKILNPRTGQVVGELQGGEPILSVETYQNNKEIVDALLHVSMHEGGKGLEQVQHTRFKIEPVYQEGGLVKSSRTAQAFEHINELDIPLFRKYQLFMRTVESMLSTSETQRHTALDELHQVSRKISTELVSAGQPAHPGEIRQVDPDKTPGSNIDRKYNQHISRYNEYLKSKSITEQQYYQLSVQAFRKFESEKTTIVTREIEKIVAQMPVSSPELSKGEAGQPAIPLPDVKPQKALVNRSHPVVPDASVPDVKPQKALVNRSQAGSITTDKIIETILQHYAIEEYDKKSTVSNVSVLDFDRIHQNFILQKYFEKTTPANIPENRVFSKGTPVDHSPIPQGENKINLALLEAIHQLHDRLQEHGKATHRLNEHLDKGLKTDFIWTEFERKQREINRVRGV